MSQPLFNRQFSAFLSVSIAGHIFLLAGIVLYRPAPRPGPQKVVAAQLVTLGKDKPNLLPRLQAAVQPSPPPAPVAARAPEVKPPPVEDPPPVARTSTVPSKANTETKPTTAPAKSDSSKSGESKKLPDPKSITTDQPTSNSRLDDAFKKLVGDERAKTRDDRGAANGSERGTVSDFTKQAVGSLWVADVQSQVRTNFNVPSTIAEQERRKLVATAIVRVGARGELLQRKIAQSSGNAQFDASVLRALDASAPLPPPPKELAESFALDGCEIEFKANGAR